MPNVSLTPELEGFAETLRANDGETKRRLNIRLDGAEGSPR